MAAPLISICIPSYERTQYLDRLMASIEQQTFRDFEVIFTDDSKTDKIKNYLESYKANFPLYYYKNTPSLGTSKNMVEGVRYANSNWIKMIHDDDFFADKNALMELSKVCQMDIKFAFSGYNEYHENSGKCVNRALSQDKYESIKRNLSILFANNLIGCPSVIMMHKSVTEFFDTKLNWFTDVEYYYRILGKLNSAYISKPLINISYNDSSITSAIHKNPKIVIPEAIYLLNLYGNKLTHSLKTYDCWWRVFRNLGIRTEKDIQQYVPDAKIPKFIISMLKVQRLITPKRLKNGVISKSFMAFSYITNKLTNNI